MKKYLKEVDLKTILIIFIGWKILIYSAYIFAFNFMKLNGTNFLGGGFKNYTNFPFVFSWANFDGEHYLSIALIGYKGLEQAFFPAYPLLIRVLSLPFEQNQLAIVITGLIISNLAYFISLVFLWKLIILDFNKQVAFWTCIILTFFPTSFYFGSMYNESLFLLLTLAVFSLVRNNNIFIASIFGFIATGTRIFGLLVLPSLILDLIKERKISVKYFWFLIIPGGFVLYLFHQYLTVGDPLAFYKLQKLVGEQHQSGITLLPQVFIRYVNILITVDPNNLIYQTMVLEVVTAIGFFLLPIYGFFKGLRWSYVFFAFFSFLMPTIQGSFSSIPRYIIVFFPSLIALSILLTKFPKWFRILFISISAVWLFCETALFLRGYWVA